MQLYKSVLFVMLSIPYFSLQSFANEINQVGTTKIEQEDSVGGVEAQRELGKMYLRSRKGNGSSQDIAKGLGLLTKAANQGDRKAQRFLGITYALGMVVPKDNFKAVEWFTKAANQGDTDSQTDLGFFYIKGEGVPQDSLKGVEWFTKAANKGDVNAQLALGGVYEGNIQGISRDTNKAKEYYKQACLNKSQDGCNFYKRLNY